MTHYHVSLQYANLAKRALATDTPNVTVQFIAWPLLNTQSDGYFLGHDPVYTLDPVVGGEWVWDFSDHNSTSASDTTNYEIKIWQNSADSIFWSGSIGYSSY